VGFYPNEKTNTNQTRKRGRKPFVKGRRESKRKEEKGKEPGKLHARKKKGEPERPNQLWKQEDANKKTLHFLVQREQSGEKGPGDEGK